MSEQSIFGDGRAASLARRRALSAAGKTGLPASGGGDVSAGRRRALPAAGTTANGATTVVPSESGGRVATPAGVQTYIPPSPNGFPDLSCRVQARQRRASISSIGRGGAPAAQPTRPPRFGQQPAVAPAAVVTEAQIPRSVTSVRPERSGLVTGAARGVSQPVSGTQYSDTNQVSQSRAVKVGFSQTPGGAIVSGSLVRSKVPITGDERGGAISVTGRADQVAGDDVTQRTSDGAGVTAVEFRRQVNPHGFATPPNIARSVQSFGSRERASRLTVESASDASLVTGSPPSINISGDEVSGSGRGPGRRVSVSQTWSGRPVTGIDAEQHAQVSGNASGASAAISGTSYQNNGAPNRQRSDAALPIRVSGNIPRNDTSVTGTARGATRDISGTPYYSASEPDAKPIEKPVAAIEERFSVSSVQRASHLRSERSPQPEKGAGRITGSFAVGTGKITGNLEFMFRPRRSAADQNESSGRLLTGEGRTSGRTITGEAWKGSNVTGTEGDFSAARNPSERAGGPMKFAGNGRFKELANKEEPKHLVTGMFGYSSDSAAKVTLSGGAQG